MLCAGPVGPAIPRTPKFGLDAHWNVVILRGDRRIVPAFSIRLSAAILFSTTHSITIFRDWRFRRNERQFVGGMGDEPVGVRRWADWCICGGVGFGDPGVAWRGLVNNRWHDSDRECCVARVRIREARC